jgi:glycosyltransferase involved in cell wall biosynthesis
MKILQINKLYYPVIGGIETVVQNIAEGFSDQAGDETAVLACQEKGRRSEEIINGVKVYRAASLGKALGMPLSLDFFRLSCRLCLQYDRIIIHYPFPLAALICPFIPKHKLVIYYHADIVRQKISKILVMPLIKASLKRAGLILTSGNNLIKHSPLLSQFADKCRAVPYGVDIDYSQGDQAEAQLIREKYSQRESLILAVGRLVYYKGLSYAIKAMTEVKAKLLIIGTGPEEKNLRQLIKDNNLEDKITIIKPQAHLHPFFLAADIFLFPSTAKSEAFGLVQLEAMAAGKAIVNTYLQTSVEEVGQDGINGLSVQPADSQALAGALNTLIADPELRNIMGARGQARYQQYYTLAHFRRRLQEILNIS